MINLPINQLLSGNFKGFFINLLLILPALLIAVSFHEAAHAWMANRMGDPTARNLGRITLDPTQALQPARLSVVRADRFRLGQTRTHKSAELLQL